MKMTLDPNETEVIRALVSAELDHKRVEIRRARNFEYKEALLAEERLLRRLVFRLHEAPAAEEVQEEHDADLFAGDGPNQSTWSGFESSSDSLS